MVGTGRGDGVVMTCDICGGPAINQIEVEGDNGSDFVNVCVDDDSIEAAIAYLESREMVWASEAGDRAHKRSKGE